MSRPDYLSQGEVARLFPVLSTTSKEGRTASIVLACMAHIEEFGAKLLASTGRKIGKRSRIECFTEICFKGDKKAPRDRPDGLIVVTTGKTTWRALVEAKISGEQLSADQIEKYRAIAKEQKIDCVITISNQFATLPSQHPLEEVNKSRSKVPVYHWSWMSVLTTADLLMSNREIDDPDREMLLFELCRFLSHESAGVKGFDRMPREWSELNRLVRAGGKIAAKSHEAQAVLQAWYQETRDLSLILSRKTDTQVTEKLPRSQASDPAMRLKKDLQRLQEEGALVTELDITNAAAPLTVIAHLGNRTIQVGMKLRAPEDKVSNKARVNWLLRQVKSDKLEDLYLKMHWPGRSVETMHQVSDLMADVGICEEGKQGLQVTAMELVLVKGLGAKFAQQTNFILELERLVPGFYEAFGQNLAGWRKPAPKIEKGSPAGNVIDLEAMEESVNEE